jgi:hypothetical protein
MAKQSLPSVDDEPATSRNYVQAKEPAQSVTTDPVVYEGYVSRRVDVKLTRSQAIKLRDKTRQLQDSGAKTSDGRYVTNRTQAVQWILENEVNT